MTPEQRGSVLAEFPRTLTIKNWPFLVLLLLMGVVPAGIVWNPWLGGDIRQAALILAAVVAVVVLIGSGQVLSEVLGNFFISAIHERGLLLRRLGTEQFVEWSRIGRIEHKAVPTSVAGRPAEIWVYEILVRDLTGPVQFNPNLTSRGDEYAELISKLSGVAIVRT